MGDGAGSKELKSASRGCEITHMVDMETNDKQSHSVAGSTAIKRMVPLDLSTRS